MRDVQEADTAERRDEEDDVKPTVVEVELQVAENFRDDCPVFITIHQHERDQQPESAF